MLWLIVGNLRRRWLEYALATVAIALVVAVVVVQRSMAASTESTVHELAHRLGKNMLVVPVDTDMAGFWRHEFGRSSLRDDAARQVMSSPLAQHVTAVESRLYGTAPVKGVQVLVVGQDVGWTDADYDVSPAVFGAAAARRLGAVPGQILPLGGIPVAVTAIAESPPDDLGDAVFVPLATAQRILRRPGAITALRLGGCWCRIDVATLGKEIERLIPGTKAMTVAGVLSAQKGSIAETGRYAALLRIASAAIVAALIAALVASQARRRVREVALLSAVGANPGWIGMIFTAEAGLTGAAGALVGYLLAVSSGPWLGRLVFGTPLPVAWDLLVPTVAITLVISIFAAAIPAARAAFSDPSVILREA
jgi:putative ABC transport system permease protein